MAGGQSNILDIKYSQQISKRNLLISPEKDDMPSFVGRYVDVGKRIQRKK